MSWPYLWFLPRALLHARGPRVSADARPSLHPPCCEGFVEDHPGHGRAAGAMRCVLMQVADSNDGRQRDARLLRQTPASLRAKQSRAQGRSGLLRFARNDGDGSRFLRRKRCLVRTVGGRSSIPEAAVLQPRRRGVLDTPPSRGMTSGGGATARAVSQIGKLPNMSPFLTLIRRCEALAFPVKARARALRQPSINGFAAEFLCSHKGLGNADSQRRDRSYRRGRRPVDRVRLAAARRRPDRLARPSAS
jgi:hypothetical protein